MNDIIVSKSEYVINALALGIAIQELSNITNFSAKFWSEYIPKVSSKQLVDMPEKQLKNLEKKQK